MAKLYGGDGLSPNMYVSAFVGGAVADHGDFPVERLALSRDGKWLASASHDEVLKMTDVGDALEESDEEGEDEEVDEDEDWTSDESGDEIFHDAPEDVNGHEASEASSSASNGDAKSRTKSNDLGWLMDGSSRATLLDTPQPDANGNDELPKWLRAKKGAVQAISDRTTTGQV